MNALTPILEDPELVFYKAGGAFFTAGTVALVAAASVAALLGLLLVSLATAPRVTSICSTALREHPLISSVAGIPLLALFALVGAIGQRVPPIGFAGAMAFLALSTVGLGAVSEEIGRRLYWICGREGSRAAHVVSGWLTLVGAVCIPLLGWFVVLPIALSSGLGSLPVALFTPAGRRVAAGREPVDVEIR